MKKCLVVKPGDDIKEDFKIVEFDEENFLKEMYSLIECDTITIPVMMNNVMLVADDEGLLKESRINRYFSPKAFNLIGSVFAGTLVFVRNEIDEETCDEKYADIKDEDIAEIMKKSNIWHTEELIKNLQNCEAESPLNLDNE